jgi:hypothetical protein
MSQSDQDNQRKSRKVATEKKIETQEERQARIKAKVDAEKAQDIDNKVKAAKKSGLSAKALDLYEHNDRGPKGRNPEKRVTGRLLCGSSGDIITVQST